MSIKFLNIKAPVIRSAQSRMACVGLLLIGLRTGALTIGLGAALNMLGGAWVVISGFTSGVTVIITHIKGLRSPLIATHESPSTGD